MGDMSKYRKFKITVKPANGIKLTHVVSGKAEMENVVGLLLAVANPDTLVEHLTQVQKHFKCYRSHVFHSSPDGYYGLKFDYAGKCEIEVQYVFGDKEG